MKYSKFYGRIYYLKRRDLDLTLKIQIALRRIGAQKPVPDVLIASICVDRMEELITGDRDFLDIAEVSGLRVRLV